MKGHEQILEFWSWFAGNESRFRAPQPVDSPLIRLIGAKLRAIDKGLFFEMAVDRFPRDFVITASGKKELFGLVDQIVALAPHLAEWKFIGLKPALGFRFKTEYKGLTIHPEECWFMPLKKKGDPTFLGLKIALPTSVNAEKTETRDAVFIVLDTGLGERLVANAINYVELENMPNKPASLGYRKLPDLAQYIETFVKSKKASQP